MVALGYNRVYSRKTQVTHCPQSSSSPQLGLDMPKGVYERTERHRAALAANSALARTPEAREENRQAKLGNRNAAGPHTLTDEGLAVLRENGRAHAGVPASHGHAVNGQLTPTYQSWR